MKTPAGLRPATWPQRTRLVAAAVALLVAVGGTLWWVTGAEGRRAGEACDLYLEQQDALQTVLTEALEAADRAEGAASDSTIGFFDDIDRELNSLRRWRSTTPQLDDALGQVADPDGGGSGSEVARTLGSVTEAVAEMQRLIEDGEPPQVRDEVPELEASMQDADDVCASL